MKSSRNETDIVNYYTRLPEQLKPPKVTNIGFKKHHVAFPCRILVCGKSNSGKTLSIINFLRLCGSQFDQVIIITQKAEPLYEMMRMQNPSSCFIYELSETTTVFPDLSSLNGKGQIFVIFDDLVNSPYMSKCKEFFIRGRKLRPYPLNMCFLTQDYYRTESMLRKQMTNLFVFRPSGTNERRCLERDFPILKTIPRVWAQLTKKDDDDINFLNIDVDKDTCRLNFSQELLSS